MPLYIADYLADTAHLGALESGAYLHLIMHYWQNGSLPADDKQLARIAKMTDREWKSNKSTLSNFFHDGWKHKRIDAELEKSGEKSAKASQSAKERWSKNSTNAYADSDANAMRTHDERISEYDANAMLSQTHTQLDIKTDAEDDILRRRQASKKSENPHAEFDGWLAGLMVGHPLSKANDQVEIRALLAQGVTKDDISQAIHALRSQSKFIPRSWSQVAGWVKRAEKDRLASSFKPDGQAPAADVGPTVRLDGFGEVPEKTIAVILAHFERSGVWLDHKFGPAPGSDGCLIPARLIDEAKSREVA